MKPTIMISICIPTFNRAAHLENCLQSINIAVQNTNCDIEVCVSDNCSTDKTAEVVRHSELAISLKYHRNYKNLGIPKNFLNVVGMAKGEYIWMIGDDDLLLPDSLAHLHGLIKSHPSVDFFYVNAFHLAAEYLLSYPQPFDTSNLPVLMQQFSDRVISGELPFFDLIDPEVSFDFLGGMFLAVFRRKKWHKHRHKLNTSALNDSRTFSHFDNTFPHVAIFSRAFAHSVAYFNTNPLVVCLTGAREWAPMYPMVRSVRLVEALEYYRMSGLPFWRYLKCRNFALRNFLPDMAWMILHPRKSGFLYFNFCKVVARNVFYPNLYLSPFYYILRKIRSLTKI